MRMTVSDEIEDSFTFKLNNTGFRIVADANGAVTGNQEITNDDAILKFDKIMCDLAGMLRPMCTPGCFSRLDFPCNHRPFEDFLVRKE